MTNTAPRERLPDRRPNQTRELTWAGSDDQPTEFSVTVGFYMDGRPAEVFCNGAKVGSTMQALLQDACVVMSIALQYGVVPAELAHSMGRTPLSETESVPASIIGAIAEVLAQGPGVEKTEATL